MPAATGWTSCRATSWPSCSGCWRPTATSNARPPGRLHEQRPLLRCERRSCGRACFSGGRVSGTGTSPAGIATTPSASCQLIGVPTLAPWLRAQLYTSSAHKQVPPIVLNASATIAGGIPHAATTRATASSGATALRSRPTARARPGPLLDVPPRRPAGVRIRRAARSSDLLPAQSRVRGARRRQGPAPAQEPRRGAPRSPAGPTRGR
jgi:hypothetical protein